MNPVANVVDGIAIAHARQLGAIAPTAGLPRDWRTHPDIAAVIRSAPTDLRPALALAYTTAYDRHNPTQETP
jgi:hypothetical protein